MATSDDAWLDAAGGFGADSTEPPSASRAAQDRDRAARRLLPANGDPGLQAIAALAARLLAAPGAEVSLLTEVRTIAAAGGSVAGRTGEQTPLSEALCTLAAASGACFTVRDARSDVRVLHLSPVMRGEVGAYLAQPLISDDGHIVGALCVYQASPRAWSAAEGELLQQLAVAASAQLEVAALGREFEDSVRRDVLVGVSKFALALTGVDDIDDLVTTVAEQGLTMLGCDGGAVAVVDPEDETTLLSYLTSSYGQDAQVTYAHIPLSARLPVAEAARTAQTVLLADRDVCLAYSSDMAGVLTATGAHAFASVPLRVGAEVLGVVTAGWKQPQTFDTEQVALLETFAAQCAQALNRLQALKAERAAAHRVARMGEALQRSLLTELPEPDHLELLARYVPAADEAQVGGDWYDAFMVRDGTTCLVIGDVSGHDQDAAVQMAQVRNVLRGVAHAVVDPPARILRSLDWAMRDLAIGALSTALLAKVEQGPRDADQGLRTLRWSNAGHLPPLLIQADGRSEFLERPHDLLLGLSVDTDRHDHSVHLLPGCTVLLYTDGLVERRGEHLEDGLHRLQTLATALSHLPLQELCDDLIARLAEDAEDDVALLAVRAHREDRPRPAEAGPRRLPADLTRDTPTDIDAHID
ncbi:GAF domain-containing SpoIIE family protein phosphatase [Kineococcus rubinsiae]|uniref:GAF domain-containing SpoIIE family protein phosphatase n=1 Tax=Kineococcus rubinsiae TaxID=2609562 RepID=UPI001431E1E5|nr:SpoIIE family protein phosphatase [Kineococcus rubinsiae]NIZ89651.1 SpoIIE family protein phosphatase [Kineococcus rubinsiae]